MNDIVLIAMLEEAPALAGAENVFFTGIGKVNGAIVASRLIERHRPKRIWNFGTAGGITVGGGIHRCSRFLQRDMQVGALGFAPGQTPFEDSVILDLGGSGLLCSSGDSFVTNPTLDLPADLVDMEAYAIAKACLAAGVDFVCNKFISDRADGESSEDWRANISAGQAHYLRILSENSVLRI
jgi:adenosylhomocysteine nucleosidase